MRCPQCKVKLVANARFCHNCGEKLSAETGATTAPWYYEPVFVLLMIFLVLAVFGLPLLWKSPRFTTWQKSLISVVTAVYTGVILWLLYYLVVVLFLPYYTQLRSML